MTTILFYSLIIDAFFLGVEYFTTFYSHIPDYTETFRYLFFGIRENNALVPWYWAMNAAIFVAILLLALPGARSSQSRLLGASAVALIGLWIDKGFILVPAAFIPNVFGTIMEYPPTWVELAISLGIYAMGALIITVFYKVVVSVRSSVNS